MTPSGRDASTTYSTVVSNLAHYCLSSGLDLLQPLQVGWYNSTVHADHRLADFGDPKSLVVLIGNTRLLWPALISALRLRQDLLDQPDPVDAYVEESINAAVGAQPLESSIRWAHRAEPHHIAIQQMAEIAGLAWRSPASLSIHPVYGPWIGLRAAVVFPIPGPPQRPTAAPVCKSCPSACLQVLSDKTADRSGWAQQLAVRDACPIGQQYRYSDLQIAYHYSKSRALLHAAISERCD